MFLFLSTSPARGTTGCTRVPYGPTVNFYPRPPRGGRPAPRSPAELRRSNFYPRPPRGGRPAASPLPPCCRRYFYPRPPRGGRPPFVPRWRQAAKISIHVPREGDDVPLLVHREIIALFLSTSPARGTTRVFAVAVASDGISIHVPREGDDAEPIKQALLFLVDFYPRPPRGGRRRKSLMKSSADYFYPRPPRGGRPPNSCTVYSYPSFLSTSPARGTTRVPAA